MELSFFLEPVNMMMFGMIAFTGVCVVGFRDLDSENPVKKILVPKVSGSEIEEIFGL